MVPNRITGFVLLLRHKLAAPTNTLNGHAGPVYVRLHTQKEQIQIGVALKQHNHFVHEVQALVYEMCNLSTPPPITYTKRGQAQIIIPLTYPILLAYLTYQLAYIGPDIE